MRRAGGGVTAGASTDDALVRSALDGSPDAFDELYRRHRDAVARTAFVLMHDAHLAQDAAQEAFLVGWRDLTRLRDPARFRSWVTGIAVNLCRRRRGGFRILPGPRPVSGEEPLTESAPDEADLRLSLQAAIARLPRSMREVLVLRFYCGFTEPEVAEALDIKIGTVKSRISRARERLAAGLDLEMEEP